MGSYIRLVVVIILYRWLVPTIYRNAKAKIRTSFGESDYFPIQKELLQGECSSAKLFTLFMDDLVTILHQSDIPAVKIASKNIHILMYASDIVVLASNVNTSTVCIRFIKRSQMLLFSVFFRSKMKKLYNILVKSMLT
jgi:hypothetical protein